MTRPLTVKEAAAAANVSDKTIYRELEAGRLVGSKVRSQWRIFESDLEAWLISLRPDSARAPAPRRYGNRRRQRGSLRASLESIEGGAS